MRAALFANISEWAPSICCYFAKNNWNLQHSPYQHHSSYEDNAARGIFVKVKARFYMHRKLVTKGWLVPSFPNWALSWNRACRTKCPRTQPAAAVNLYPGARYFWHFRKWCTADEVFHFLVFIWRWKIQYAVVVASRLITCFQFWIRVNPRFFPTPWETE